MPQRPVLNPPAGTATQHQRRWMSEECRSRLLLESRKGAGIVRTSSQPFVVNRQQPLAPPPTATATATSTPLAAHPLSACTCSTPDETKVSEMIARLQESPRIPRGSPFFLKRLEPRVIERKRCGAVGMDLDGEPASVCSVAEGNQDGGMSDEIASRGLEIGNSRDGQCPRRSSTATQLSVIYSSRGRSDLCETPAREMIVRRGNGVQWQCGRKKSSRSFQPFDSTCFFLFLLLRR